MRTLGRLLSLTLSSLTDRSRHGEGGLVAINAALIAIERPPLAQAAAKLVLSVLVLAVAYAVNDWRDVEGDLKNPKKNQRLVRAMADLRRPFGVWLCIAHAGLVALAVTAVGTQCALAVASMLAVNAAYSWCFKSVPLVDFLIVGVWGGAYAAVATSLLDLCLIVGLMTAIMHVYQVQVDRDVDRENAVATTAVRLPWAANAAVLLLCAGLYFALWPRIGPIGSLSAFVPFLLRIVIAHTPRAWMASRVCFGVVLLALIAQRFRGDAAP